MLIALSVGHHQRKKGATYAGVTEYEKALEWVGMIASESKGDIVMVPVGDLQFKVAYINGINADVAYEMHFNSYPGRSVISGCETLYHPRSVKGKKLAELSQAALVKEIGNIDRGAKEGWYRMDRPSHKDYSGDIEGDEVVDYFLRKTQMPSAILEPMFLKELVKSKKYNPLTNVIARRLAKALVESANAAVG